jgi:hypothetical protein
MRVLILGIDALEYDLVVEWDLQNLKQQEFGKVIVPITPSVGEPATEIVWPCFITGKEPAEMGFTSPYLYRQPYKWFFDHFYGKKATWTDIHPDNILEQKTAKRHMLDKMSSIMTKIGMFYHPSRKDIKAPTLFDNTSLKTMHFHIPVYDKDCFPEYRKHIVEVLMKQIPASEYTQTVKQSFQERCNELTTYLKENKEWDVVMMYWFCLDAVQHAFFKNKLKIMDFYLLFNTFVGELKSLLPPDTVVLIISDHGQHKGIHSDHGFYSLNKKLGLKEPHITEFKTLIEKLVLKDKKE